MDIQAHIPNKALLTWCKRNADRIAVLDYQSSGCCDDEGRERPHYEVLLEDGWHFTHGGHRTYTDTQGASLIHMLRHIEPCPPSCKER